MSNIATEDPTTSTRTPEDVERDIRRLYYELYIVTPKEDAAVKKARREAALAESYKAENGLTIHGLRKAGNKVQVTHIRNVIHEGIPVPVPAPSYLRNNFHFYEKGGATHVAIIDKAGNSMVFTAVCHLVDNYCYKMGVKVALDRIPEETAKALIS